MPITPDPIAVLQTQMADVQVRVSKLEAAPTPAAPDAAAAFIARWAPVMPDEFVKKYGVAYGQPIPKMPGPDTAEASYRARCWYNPQYGTPGLYFSFADEQADVEAAVNVIAHATQQTATQFYECGFDQALACDPNALAFVFLLGVVKTRKQLQQNLGAGTQPSAYAGKSLDDVVAACFVGGKPSGG